MFGHHRDEDPEPEEPPKKIDADITDAELAAELEALEEEVGED